MVRMHLDFGECRKQPRRRAGITGHGVGRDADLQNGVRVGGAQAGQALLLGKRRGSLVGGATDHACVVDLNPVDRGGDRRQIGATLAAVAAEAIEWVRHTDKAALLADGGDRLDCGEARLDELLDEDRHKIAVGGLDFLADDDRQPVGDRVTCSQRGVDAVVVGHGQMRQPARNGRSHDGLGSGERVETGTGVAVEIDERPACSIDRILRERGHYSCVPRYFLKKSKCSRAMPVPRATQCMELSATWQGTPVTWASSLSMFRSTDPPPDMTMPLSMMSLDSSGGVCSRTRRTAPMIC